MKKRSLLSLMVVLAILLSMFTTVLAEEVIKIGGIGVLSGDYSKYGWAVREGVDLYVKQVNEAGGINGKQVEMLWEDTAADAATAISASTGNPAESRAAIVTCERWLCAP